MTSISLNLLSIENYSSRRCVVAQLGNMKIPGFFRWIGQWLLFAILEALGNHLLGTGRIG
jgi:hypothetical protein